MGLNGEMLVGNCMDGLGCEWMVDCEEVGFEN